MGASRHYYPHTVPSLTSAFSLYDLKPPFNTVVFPQMFSNSGFALHQSLTASCSSRRFTPSLWMEHSGDALQEEQSAPRTAPGRGILLKHILRYLWRNSALCGLCALCNKRDVDWIFFVLFPYWWVSGKTNHFHLKENINTAAFSPPAPAVKAIYTCT